MKNIVLLGMRGSGKSTIGALLAKELKKKFFDTDAEIEKEIQMSISDFVKKEGWNAFREREKKICAALSQEKNSVIATGGGIILDTENIHALKKNGVLFFLNVPMPVLAQRIEAQNANHRPAFTKKTTEEELQELWKNRKEKYFSAADIILSGENTPKNIVKTIKKYV